MARANLFALSLALVAAPALAQMGDAGFCQARSSEGCT
jgi:hypothetical protein